MTLVRKAAGEMADRKPASNSRGVHSANQQTLFCKGSFAPSSTPREQLDLATILHERLLKCIDAYMIGRMANSLSVWKLFSSYGMAFPSFRFNAVGQRVR